MSDITLGGYTPEFLDSNLDSNTVFYTSNDTGSSTITLGEVAHKLQQLTFKNRIPLENLDNTIAAATKSDGQIKELIIRQGEAKEVANKPNVTIKGNIDAPSRFVEHRTTTPQNSYCYYSQTNGEIVLHTNDGEPFGQYSVIGKIAINKKYLALGINNPEATLAPKVLARKFKMLRRMFPSRDDHMKICNTLNKFEANVKKELEESQNDRGDYTSLRNQIVESNIPESFLMKVPIIEGEEAVEILVHTVITADGNTLKCALESVDAAEYIEDFFETKVLEEVAKLEGKTTLISR